MFSAYAQRNLAEKHLSHVDVVDRMTDRTTWRSMLTSLGVKPLKESLYSEKRNFNLNLSRILRK